MQISARNQLEGEIIALRTDGLMAEVTIALKEGQRLVALINRESAEGLGFWNGDQVTAVIKATEVIVAK